MLKLNRNKTFKELSVRGFYYNNKFDFYFDVNTFVKLKFSNNYTSYNDNRTLEVEYTTANLESAHDSEDDVNKKLKELLEEGFLIDDEKC